MNWLLFAICCLWAVACGVLWADYKTLRDANERLVLRNEGLRHKNAFLERMLWSMEPCAGCAHEGRAKSDFPCNECARCYAGKYDMYVEKTKE